ncbi:MAG: hypothetical protein H6704_29565 [Myxococcales bacterium]|nr:hypothetical protein [Myxococcales bacterium]
MRKGVGAALLLVWVATGCEDSGGGAAACVYNSDCPVGQMCALNLGGCVAECRADRDCARGACVGGACVEGDAAPGTDGPPSPDAAPRPDATAPDAAADATGGADAAPADAAAPRPPGFGALTGQVHFRLFDDRVLPVARPTVYWAFPDDPIPPLPGQASCDCGYPPTAATGEVDGTFTLRNLPAGPVWLVVQKGHFRRVRRVEVRADETVTLPLEVTELPVRDDPAAGDSVPRIAIGTGRFDAIEDIFAKLRLGPITPLFGFDYDAYMADPDAWGVDLFLYQQPRALDDDDRALAAPDFLAHLSSLEDALAYHFTFAPCAEYGPYGTWLTSRDNRQLLERYVNFGGKLYVTDYSYDLLEQVWPTYVDFAAPDGREGNADGHVGDPDYLGEAAYGTLMYASQNRALDPDLAAWLDVVGVSPDGRVQTSGNWVNLNGVGGGEQCCRDGAPVEVTPTVVMSGPNGVDPFIGNFGPSHPTWDAAEAEGANRPHTLRFPFGCGEVMYSTYHTVDDQRRTADLRPQELVLLWLILEINECNLDPIKPG